MKDRTYRARTERFKAHRIRLNEKYGSDDWLWELADAAIRRGAMLASKEAKPWEWYPRRRVAPILKEFVARNPREDNIPLREGVGGLEALAFITGMTPRSLYRIIVGHEQARNGRRVDIIYVRFDIVDRVFTAIGCQHLFHLDPEQGGFSDLYLHPEALGEQVAA